MSNFNPEIPNFEREAFNITTPPPPGNLVRDAAFLEMELVSPLSEYTIVRHLHQTGQSLVDEVENNEGLPGVVKTNYREIQKTFGQMARVDVPLEEAQAMLRDKRSETIQDFKERRLFLQEHFGKAVPDESWEVRTVTIPGATLRHILGEGCNNKQPVPENIDFNTTYQIEAFVRTQAYDTAYQDPDRLTTAMRYAEFVWYNKENPEPLDIDNYIDVTLALTQPGAETLTLENSGSLLNTLIEVQDSIWLERMLITVANDPGKYSAPVRDFLTKLDEFHTITGGMTIDAMGIDNVTFDSEGICHMGDALETQKVPMLTIARSALIDIAEGKLPTKEQANIVINIFNYARGINAIAIASGSPVRVMLPLPPGKERITIERVLALVEANYGIPQVAHRIPIRPNAPDIWEGALAA
jgi:hypothetical protein